MRLAHWMVVATMSAAPAISPLALRTGPGPAPKPPRVEVRKAASHDRSAPLASAAVMAPMVMAPVVRVGTAATTAVTTSFTVEQTKPGTKPPVTIVANFDGLGVGF